MADRYAESLLRRQADCRRRNKAYMRKGWNGLTAGQKNAIKQILCKASGVNIESP